MPRSRRPPDRPRFFVDRNLGRYLVPNAPRERGFEVNTMLSVFGENAEETVADSVWLERAGHKKWVVLTTDAAIRRRPAELEQVELHRLRVFCITRGGLTGPAQRDRILTNINRIVQRAAKDGPWICALYADHIAQIWPAVAPAAGTPRSGADP